MNEEEIIKEIEYQKSFGTSGILPRWAVIDGLLDLYNKEKEKNKELEKRLTPTPDNAVPLEYQSMMYVDKRGYVSKDKIKEFKNNP